MLKAVPGLVLVIVGLVLFAWGVSAHGGGDGGGGAISLADEEEIEQLLKEQFGRDVDYREIIAGNYELLEVGEEPKKNLRGGKLNSYFLTLDDKVGGAFFLSKFDSFRVGSFL